MNPFTLPRARYLKPYLLVSLKIFALIALGLALTAHAAHAVGVVDDITQPFRVNSRYLADNFLLYARSLFWKLAAIQFAYMAITLILKGGDIQQWVTCLIRQILFIGFYSYLMEHSYDFGCRIIAGFRQMGQGSGTLNPQNIFSVGHDIALKIIHHVSLADFTLAIVQGLSAMIICCAFSLIAALIIVALCEGYVLIGVGVLLTGLGGSEWTRDFANKSLIMSFGIGIKLLTFYMLYQIGFEEMQHWTGYEFENSQQCLEIMGGSIIYLLLMLRLPQLAQQMLNGAISGSTALAELGRLSQHTQTLVGVGSAAQAATSAGLQHAAQETFKAPSPGQPASMADHLKKPVIFATQAAVGTFKAAQSGIRDEIYGHLSGSALRGGNAGGRIGHYIRQRAAHNQKKDP